MVKKYTCEDCGAACPKPVYVRLHLTRCGWNRASGQRRWQKSIRVGRFCVACLLNGVRTLLGDEKLTSDLGSSLQE
jgi:hypothetical protein